MSGRNADLGVDARVEGLQAERLEEYRIRKLLDGVLEDRQVGGELVDL